MAAIMPIMVIPPQVIIIGIPAFIIVIMRWQHSMNISFMDGSIGVMSQLMPAGVIVQVILHIIIPMGIPMGIVAPIIGIGIDIIGMDIIGIGIIEPGIIPVMPIAIGIIACIGIVAFIANLRSVSSGKIPTYALST